MFKQGWKQHEPTFYGIAKQILGSGYTKEYYDTIVDELKWAYDMGEQDALEKAGVDAD